MKIRTLCICILANVAFAACHSKHHEKDNELSLTVTSPITIDTSIDKEYVCQIRAINHIEIRSQERGYLQKIFVDEGQYIHKGQPMFQIMPMLYQAEMEKSKAEAKYTELEFQNTKLLSDKNIVSKQELALSKAKLDKANAELKLSNAHLGLATIRAPFNGIMDKFDTRLGGLVEEGELLTTLSDNSQLWVYFNVPESEYLDYAQLLKNEGPQKVKLLLANNELYNQEGTFSTVEADFNNETGNIAFRATFPNPDRLLRHGQTGTILLPSHLHNVILIPQAATFDILDKKFVYIVDQSGQIHAKQVTVSIELPHLYVISSGLSNSDKILLDGLRKVKNKDKIKPVFKPFSKVIDELSHLEAE